MSYLLDNDLICVQQFGFMQGRSTCLQLLNDLMVAWENSTKVDVIYLDIMKAFDTVHYECLLYEISRHGMKDSLHGWIRSFFLNKSQCVIICGCKSESVSVTNGIPQVCVLGPLLFIIYINDLPDSVK